jgi:D-alanyl-D-alanine carboxypeptidase
MTEFQYNGMTYKTHNYLLNDSLGTDGMKTGYTAASGFNILTSAQQGKYRVIAVTMGHKFLNERDKKAYKMMDLGLDHMNKNKEVNVAELTGAINGQKSQIRVASNTAIGTNVVASKKSIIPTSKPQQVAQTTKADTQYASVTNGKYALQIGTFSDFSRAKNYALQIKNKIAKTYAVHDIMVEKIASPKGDLFRSKVVGFAKNDATKICQSMKKINQACLVVSDKSKLKVAQRG